MSAADLMARNVGSVESYINISANAVVDISPMYVPFVVHCYHNALRFLKRIGVPQRIPAPMIVFTTNDVYEGGFPHTRMNVIFMNELNVHMGELRLSSLFVHELIHIFQRMHPEITARRLSDFGFLPIRKIVGSDNVRANPDTDKLLYVGPTGKIAAEIYRSPRPWSITDIDGEHPYETMAYEIQKESVAYFNAKNIL
jgi:hypothetical protein